MSKVKEAERLSEVTMLDVAAKACRGWHDVDQQEDSFIFG